MGIVHRDQTDVYCDSCGRWLVGWNIHINNISVKFRIQEDGATTGEKIVCRQCRAANKRENCTLIKKMIKNGQGKPDYYGYACGGYGTEESDEPCEKCKNCIAYHNLDMEEYAREVKNRRNKKYRRFE